MDSIRIKGTHPGYENKQPKKVRSTPWAKVSQTNKWSWYQAIDLPNYVVHVYQSIYEKIRIFGLNFGDHAILLFPMGITMGKEPKNKISHKKHFLMEFWQI